MAADINYDSGTMDAGFVRVIKDFSQYLAARKQAGYVCLDISQKSKDLISSWGNKTVFCFQGSENASVFIIDSQGSFFKGESGELLIKILKAMGLAPDSVFICNIGDLDLIDRKIKQISPEVIITLGPEAGQSLLNIKQPLEKFRGRFHEYEGIKVMPTFHPSLLVKQDHFKRQVWEDMKLVMKLTGLKHGS